MMDFEEFALSINLEYKFNQLKKSVKEEAERHRKCFLYLASMCDTDAISQIIRNMKLEGYDLEAIEKHFKDLQRITEDFFYEMKMYLKVLKEDEDGKEE